MARGPIPFMVIKTNGDAVVGAAAQINLRSAGPATVFASETGSGTLSNPLSSDTDGQLRGWLDEGSYDIVVSGAGITTVTRQFEILKGGGSLAEADTSVTTPKIVDGSITASKLGVGAVNSSKIVDGVVSDTKLTSPTSSVWRTVMTSFGEAQGINGGPYFFNNTAHAATALTTTGASVQGLWGFTNTADYAVAGKTTQMRARYFWATNSIAPATNIVWEFYPIATVGGPGGAIGLFTVGSVIAASTVLITTPTANSVGAAVSGTWNLSSLTANVAYIPTIRSGGAQTTSSIVFVTFVLEMRHV